MVKLVKIVSNDPKTNSTTYLADDGNQYVLKGDLAQRANNPGNISPSGKKARGHYESNFGAIGYLPSSKGEPAVAVFPDFESGQAAQVYLWQTPRYQSKTIEQAAKAWASSPYVDALVVAAGVPKGTLVKDLAPEQLSAIVSAQAGQEGGGQLSISDTNGNPVPVELAAQLGAVRRPPLGIGGALNGLSAPATGVVPPPLPRVRPEPPSIQIPLPRIRPDVVTPMPGRPPSLNDAPTVTLPPPNLPLNPPMPPRPRSFWTNPKEEVQPNMSGRSIVPPRTLSIPQIGQEYDNGRISGYRDIQEMGPSLPPSKPPSIQIPKVGASVAPPQAGGSGLQETRYETRANPAYAAWTASQTPAAPAGGMGAVAGLSGIGGGVSGVIKPPTIAPPKTITVPIAAPAPLTPTAPAVAAPQSPAFNVFNYLGDKAKEAGTALGNTAMGAIDSVKTGVGNTVQGATDLLKNDLIGTVHGRTILMNAMMGLPAPGSHDPYRYGDTQAERNASAAARAALQGDTSTPAPEQPSNYSLNDKQWSKYLASLGSNDSQRTALTSARNNYLSLMPTRKKA